MPLRGNLQNLRLGDVLQTVLASGGRGLLRVRSGTRRAVLHLSDHGLRVLEPEVLDDRMVLDAFVRRAPSSRTSSSAPAAWPGRAATARYSRRC